MYRVLIHSSKTMLSTIPTRELTAPALELKASELRAYLSDLSVAQLQKTMHVSASLAQKIHKMYDGDEKVSAAAEIFRGDIYSGLRANDFTSAEQVFAQKHLRILSGMYGILRPYDGIVPYRLEAGYKFPRKKFSSIYEYWGKNIATQLQDADTLINCTSVEYEKLVLPHLDGVCIITPKFMSVVHGSEPKFVAVHAKIARGAYARWIVKQQSSDMPDVSKFSDLGYEFYPELSTNEAPMYVAKKFEGIGLSQRLV